MVRSKNSCFKILTCGSDSVDKDELAESKGSMDRRGWSFRKRSARHRVLSNTVISETLSNQNKESPESTRIDFHTQSNPTTPEKISISQSVDETPPLSMAIKTKEPNSMFSTEIDSKNDLLVSTDGKVDSLTTSEDASDINHSLDESVIILIQAAIRGYLARRALLKIKNAVKLQAVFRGHLVRRQAIGTLRCVQAIVKMQALVRARRYRMPLQCPISDEKVDRKPEKSNQSMDPLSQENLGTKANRNFSTEKWLGNSFARQLLESAPKRKPIHIKCDPSRPDSAWKWLERWMAVSSSDSVQPQKQLNPEDQEQGQLDTTSELRTDIPAEVLSDSADVQPVVTNMAVPLEVEENLITYDAGNFEFHPCQPRSNESKDDMQQRPHDVAGFSISKETSLTVDASQIEIQSDATSSSLPCSIPSEPEADVEQSNHTLKRAASEQPETGVKKFAFGSSKACNPAFATVQSKFEELSSPTTSVGSLNSTGQVVGVEPKQENLSSPAESVTRIKELSVAESLISPEARVYIGGSKCGTEFSISSTLDSPDRSEDGVGDSKHEVVMEKVGSVPIEATDNVSNAVNIGNESKNGSSISELSLSCTATQVEVEDVKGDSFEAAVISPQVEQQLGSNASEVQSQVESPLDEQICKSSPEGSPRSHITASESHGTPSSLVSTKAKRRKSDKSKHTRNRKSQSAGKQSASNPNHDSGASSTEQLPKDSKNGKRRNSFGSSRADNVEQEQRDSSSNSLPSYMQATESARAKAHANNSPRSSPDVQDKDFYIKKRHSLPAANGKQGSPRIQRSMSQAQPAVKGNGTFTHDRKWQR